MVATNGLKQPLEAGPELRGAPMGRMAHVGGAGRLLCKATDGHHAAIRHGTFEIEGGDVHLVACRPPIRIRAIGLMWMCRDDVPEQDVFFDPELGENAVDDRRARLRRAAPGQLALRGEREAGNASTAVPGRLADEHDRRVPPAVEIAL
jgi:hypothetical protein